MRIFIKYIFVFTIVFNLISCQPSSYFKSKNSSTPINSSIANQEQVDSLIKPYKEKLDAEMNEVLVISAEEFPKERGKSETKLGNLVADLSLEVANELYKPIDNDSIDFCLLNFGGLRTSLPKGEITRGKVFELMPFENELVVVTISKYAFDYMIGYIYSAGGQPISKGITLVEYVEKNSDVLDMKFLIKEDMYRENKEFKILTSDYLAYGGDKMNFFLDPLKIEPVGIKLRDAIIKYCVSENKKGKQLTSKIEGRITFE
ncbi:5'-nucleotidase C-terminal domain-containing protein [Vicingaceae bacterium]|nr:5'-nucleotidase C-terminal domain-containing protein [Vicingaceae bacterium]